MSEKKTQRFLNVWWTFPLIFITTSTTSYTYFNYYASFPSQPNPLISFTYICYTTQSYTLLLFIITLTWLLLLLLYNFKENSKFYNIFYLWGSTKTFINQIVDNFKYIMRAFYKQMKLQKLIYL